MNKVLVVVDDREFLRSTDKLLRHLDQEVYLARNLAEARDALADASCDLLIVDLLLPDGSGLELVGELDDDTTRHIALLAGEECMQSRVQQLAGPQLTVARKPIDRAILERLVQDLETADERSTKRFDLLVGESEAMRRLYTPIERVAPTDVSVLILGESGTGKELVAQAVHQQSHRDGHFIAVNCGAFSRELAGSELFGHEKGAFTGAIGRRAGCFERAEGGTLFLDEITEMPPDLQPMLLRVLETGRFLPVGSQREREADCRIIAASNVDPAQAVADGKLREDLYYRIAQFTLSVPALRDRGDDVIALAETFMREASNSSLSLTLSDQSRDLLREHRWQGNVRELRHVVQRAVLLREPDTTIVDLASAMRATPQLSNQPRGITPGRSIADIERELIEVTLAHFDGSKKQAAHTLGVSVKTLYNRLNAYQADHLHHG